MKTHFNRLFIGVITGLLIPVITLLIFNQAAFDQLNAGEFIRYMIHRGKLSSVLSLVILPDLLLFFIFIWLDYLYSARGVLAATLIFALLVVISKFLI